MKLFLVVVLIFVNIDQITKGIFAGEDVVLNREFMLGFGSFDKTWVALLAGWALIVFILWVGRDIIPVIVACLLVAGAMSNSLDLMIHGGVRDVFPSQLGTIMINLADLYIFTAVLVVMILGIREVIK